MHLNLNQTFFFNLLNMNQVFQTLKVGNVLKISSFCDVMNSLLHSVYAFPISHYLSMFWAICYSGWLG